MVRHEQFREQFREAFNNYAQTHDVNQNVDQTIQPANFEDIIINFINDFDVTNVEHKETLFKLKLKVFELEIVKNSKSAEKFKNAKTFIRKSESPVEVLLGYMVFANGAELKMADTEKFTVEGVYIPIK